MRQRIWTTLVPLLLAFGAGAAPAAAQELMQPPQPPSYADLVTLAAGADVVMQVEVEGQATVKPERAPGLAPGMVRLYLETRTEAVLVAPTSIRESNAFLVDRWLNSKGKPPKLKKVRYLVFAKLVPGRPGELQLVDPQAMLLAEPEIEQRVRHVLGQLAQEGIDPLPTGIRDVISVPGNLAGESETQMFVETASGVPVSLTVIRRPGMAPQWGVSWSDIVDQSARAPQPETVEWYRLACFLPEDLPPDSFLQRDRASRAQARADYALIKQDLGPCERRLGA